MMIPTVTLPRGLTVGAAAHASRLALESFAALAPTRSALADWLSTYYRNALVGPGEVWPSVALVDDVEGLIRRVQRRIVELEREARDPAAAFVAALPMPASIARTRDHHGNIGVAPVEVPGAPLEPRVVSLFLVDYLSRPEYYLTTAARDRWVTMGTGTGLDY